MSKTSMIYGDIPPSTLPSRVPVSRSKEVREFGGSDLKGTALGVSEEVGELCHAVLKQSQGIRCYDDYEKFREDAGDAVADIMVFCIQMATLLRLDAWTLLKETSETVMERKWKND